MKSSFENSVSVLVRAYMNDTLNHFKCAACACGNLMGGSITWSFPVYVYRQEIGTRTHEMKFDEDKIMSGRELILRSGYSVEQLARIEDAFMNWTSNGTIRGRLDTFESLMRVVDVLAEIHGVDLSTKEAAVGQFREVQLQKV